ncbi:MAG: GNAT family protein, partial [Bacteroidota bacterium]
MIKTERLILRPWKKSDAEALAKIGNNINIARNMRDRFPHPYLTANALLFIAEFEKENPQKVFGIFLNDEPIGSVGVFPDADIYRKNAELGYWIGEPFWNKGYATEAVTAMLDYGFKSFEIERIYAAVFSYNDASKKVVEKSGFNFEAKLHNTVFKNGEFCDELIYS